MSVPITRREDQPTAILARCRTALVGSPGELLRVHWQPVGYGINPSCPPPTIIESAIMGLEYINRRGDRYFVLQGLTKTGKPKYYAARKSSGVPVTELPPGFELHENPATAIVTVRKCKPSRVLPSELEFLRNQTRRLAATQRFLIERDGDCLVVYVSDQNDDELEGYCEVMGFPMTDAFKESFYTRSTYTAMFRLTLTDDKNRFFEVERYCFRGTIDSWIPLSHHPQPLRQIGETYLPHLGAESFFDLI